MLVRITALLAAGGIWAGASSSATAQIAIAPINLANDGVGYIEPTEVGSAFTVTYLQNMIGVYNGTQTSPINSEIYTVDRGTSTPTAPLPLVTSLGNIITPSKADGYGLPTATVHLGAGGYTYLTAQWDGPNGANVVYYIAGLSGDITIKNDLPGTFNDKNGGNHPQSQLGLSGYELIAVPEPTTMIAGALLLLPFGASTLRALRNRRNA